MTRNRSRNPSQVPGCLNQAALPPPMSPMIESERRKKQVPVHTRTPVRAPTSPRWIPFFHLTAARDS
jgi:hypothetical protein